MTSLFSSVRHPSAGQPFGTPEVIAWQRQIEAGVLARAIRLGDPDLVGLVDVTITELLLLERIGAEARQQFISANLPLVAMVARQFSGRGGVASPDLFQEGCLGLMIAVERFDYARGNRFSTYALFWIRAYIGAATARHLGDLNLPTSRAVSLRAAQTVEADLAQRLGRRPSVAEVAAALGRGQQWTADLMAHERPVSIDEIDVTTIDDAGALVAFDRLHGARAEAGELLERLDHPARDVLELRLGFVTGEPESLAETARRLGLSVGRVRRLESAGIETLRAICPHQAYALL